jgi:hypothetical protein
MVKKRFLSCSRRSSIRNFSYCNFTIMIFLHNMKNFDFSQISLKNGTEKSIKMNCRLSQILFIKRIFLSTIHLKTPSYIIIKTLIKSFHIFLSGSIRLETPLSVCSQRKKRRLVSLSTNNGK